MIDEFLKWIIGVVTSVGFLTLIGYLMRNSIGRFFTKSIEYRFEKKIERFKSDIREGEKELEQVRSYLSSIRSGRDTVLQGKKFAAAESLIQVRQFLYEFNMAITYIKMLKIDELSKKSGDHKVKGFLDAIIKPIKIDEKLEGYKKFDTTTPKLYLSDRTVTVFEIYESIMLCGGITIKFLDIAPDQVSDFMTYESLVKKIIEFIPSSKDGFETYGDNYVFYWSDYFYKEVLKQLRNELIGDSNMAKDTELAAKLAIDFRDAQQIVKESLGKYGLSEELMNSNKVRV